MSIQPSITSYVRGFVAALEGARPEPREHYSVPFYSGLLDGGRERQARGGYTLVRSPRALRSAIIAAGSALRWSSTEFGLCYREACTANYSDDGSGPVSSLR